MNAPGDYDERHDEQDVDESTEGASCHQTDEPEDKEDDRKNHQHGEGALGLFFLLTGEVNGALGWTVAAHRTRA